MVHIFGEDDCLCQLTASRYIHEVKGKASSFGKTNITVNVEDILVSRIFIAVFDFEGSLAYLGPYSTFIGCLLGNSKVEPYLDRKATLGAIISLEATCCYCNKV